MLHNVMGFKRWSYPVKRIPILFVCFLFDFLLCHQPLVCFGGLPSFHIKIVLHNINWFVSIQIIITSFILLEFKVCRKNLQIRFAVKGCAERHVVEGTGGGSLSLVWWHSLDAVFSLVWWQLATQLIRKNVWLHEWKWNSISIKWNCRTFKINLPCRKPRFWTNRWPAQQYLCRCFLVSWSQGRRQSVRSRCCLDRRRPKCVGSPIHLVCPFRSSSRSTPSKTWILLVPSVPCGSCRSGWSFDGILSTVLVWCPSSHGWEFDFRPENIFIYV